MLYLCQQVESVGVVLLTALVTPGLMGWCEPMGYQCTHTSLWDQGQVALNTKAVWLTLDCVQAKVFF